MIMRTIGLYLLAMARVTAQYGTSYPAVDSRAEVIEADVCIIGGGASGTYAAIRLHDSRKKMVLIEQNLELGGQTHSYMDPDTNEGIDYGAYNFQDLPVTRKYLQRLNIPFEKTKSTRLSDSWYLNLRTGKRVPPDSNDMTSALRRYEKQVARYPSLGKGFYLPEPVPEDLLMPFGDFVLKYNLTDMVRFTASGFGDSLKQPTVYILKLYNSNMLDGIREGFIHTVNQSHEIYTKALRVLRRQVLLQSRIISVERSADGHQTIHVETPEGIKAIKSKKLLIEIPPVLDGMVNFDLDETEKAVFGSFQNTGFYATLVHYNSSLPNDTIVLNSDPDTPYNLPRLPAVYTIIPSKARNYFVVDYGSRLPLPESMVKSDILISFKKALDVVSDLSATGEPQIVAYRSHSPYMLTVSPDDIKAGFYNRLYGLQGHRNTFYTGAAFHTYDSAELWQFTEDLLPRIIGS